MTPGFVPYVWLKRQQISTGASLRYVVGIIGCMSEPVDVQEPIVKNEVLSQGAETVIQHLQTQLGAQNETNGVQVWLTPGVDWVQPLQIVWRTTRFGYIRTQK